jgi:nitroreductase
MNDVISLLKAHKSIRKFQKRTVEEHMVRLIVEASQSASTSSFMQAYTIIRIKDEEKKAKISELVGEQPYVKECPLFLVFCADLERHRIACEMNGVEMVEGYTEPFILGTVDAAIAAQNAIIAAESMGLGGVYIGGIRNNSEEISKLLKIPTNVYPVFGMCLGYPDQDPGIKPRLPMEVILKEDEYSSEGDRERLRKYDEIINQYYIERTNGGRGDTWTGMMAKKMSKVIRPHMRSFLEKHGFKMK